MENDNTTTRNLHLKRMAMWDNSMANHESFINKETGLFQEHLLEKRTCPACGSNDHNFLFNKSGGTYVNCNKCEMVFLNPVFKDEVLSHYYRNNHDLQSTIVTQDFGFYRDLYVKGLSGFELLFSNNKDRSILDIGCSAGGFLNIVKEKGWSTFGLELNKQEAIIARENNHSVHEMILNDFTKTSEKKFNVITLWDVFEHIKDGASLLDQARSILHNDGGVFIQSPTPTALAARILQSKCNMFDGLEHVNLYTYENIKQLAHKTGYEVYNYTTVIAEKGVINNYLNYQDPYLGTAKPIWDFLTEEMIINNNLGYKFQIFLKKK